MAAFSTTNAHGHANAGMGMEQQAGGASVLEAPSP